MKDVNRVVMMRDAHPAAEGAGSWSEELLPIVSILARPENLEGALQELVRQLQALLDGWTSPVSEGDRVSEPAVIEIGELRVDRAGHRAQVDGEELALTNLEFNLLVLLTERREQVQSRGKLLEEIWKRNTGNRTRTVDTHVKRLRDKLKSAARFIQTVRGVGYRFSESSVDEARRTPAVRGRRDPFGRLVDARTTFGEATSRGRASAAGGGG